LPVRYLRRLFGAGGLLKIDFHTEIELPPSAELACELTALQHQYIVVKQVLHIQAD
jgi:hypothetical protein